MKSLEMKMIVPSVLVILFTLFAACATEPLPQDRREVTYIEKTDLSAPDVYRGVLAYLGKTLGDSNMAIKVRDDKANTVISQIMFDCSEMKGLMDPNTHKIFANLEVNAKQNRTRFVFEALEDRVYNGINGAYILTKTFSSEEQVKAAKPCFQRVKADITKSFTTARHNSEW